jgi:hypothetical protein
MYKNLYRNMKIFYAQELLPQSLFEIMQCVHPIICTANSSQDTQCGYKRDAEERSHNHRCRVQAVSIIHFEYASVALFNQHAKRMRRIILSSVP